MSGLQSVILGFFLQTPIHGAYTELFAGLSPQITPDKTGAWGTSGILSLPLTCMLTWRDSVIPWGRFGTLRKDLEAAAKTKGEGGTGRAKDFWEWSEKQVKPYL